MADNKGLLDAAINDQHAANARRMGLTAATGIYGNVAKEIFDVTGLKDYIKGKFASKPKPPKEKVEAAPKEAGPKKPKRHKDAHHESVLSHGINRASMMDSIIEQQYKTAERLRHEKSEIGDSKPGGIFHGGMENVPKEQSYILDEGERVVSPKQNEDLTGFLKDARSLKAQGQDSERPLKVIGVRAHMGFFDQITMSDQLLEKKKYNERVTDKKDTRDFRESLLSTLRNQSKSLLSQIVNSGRRWWKKFERHPVLTTMMTALKALSIVWIPAKKMIFEPMGKWFGRHWEDLFGRKYKDGTDRIVKANQDVVRAIRGQDISNQKGIIPTAIHRLLQTDIRGLFNKDTRRNNMDRAQKAEDLITSGVLTPEELLSVKGGRMRRMMGRGYEHNISEEKLEKLLREHGVTVRDLAQMQKGLWANGDWIIRRGERWKNRQAEKSGRNGRTIDGEYEETGKKEPKFHIPNRSSKLERIWQKLFDVEKLEEKHLKSIEKHTGRLAMAATFGMLGKLLSPLAFLGKGLGKLLGAGGLGLLLKKGLDLGKGLLKGGWNKAKELGKAAWDATKGVAGKVWDKAKGLAGSAWDKTKSFAGSAWDKAKGLGGRALNAGRGLLSSAGGALRGLGARALGLLGPAGLVAGAGGLGYTLGSLIEPYVRQIGDAILAPFNTDWIDFVGGGIAKVVDGIAGAWDSVKESFTSAWGSISSGLTSIWEDAKKKITGAWDSITNWFSDTEDKTAAEDTGSMFDGIKSWFTDDAQGVAVDAIQGAAKGGAMMVASAPAQQVTKEVEVISQGVVKVAERAADKSKESFAAVMKDTNVLLKEIRDKNQMVTINNARENVVGIMQGPLRSLVNN